MRISRLPGKIRDKLIKGLQYQFSCFSVILPSPPTIVRPQEVVEKLGDLSKIDISAEVMKLFSNMSQNRTNFLQPTQELASDVQPASVPNTLSVPMDPRVPRTVSSYGHFILHTYTPFIKERQWFGLSRVDFLIEWLYLPFCFPTVHSTFRLCWHMFLIDTFSLG